MRGVQRIYELQLYTFSECWSKSSSGGGFDKNQKESLADEIKKAAKDPIFMKDLNDSVKASIRSCGQ